MLIHFLAIWNILQTLGYFYDHAAHFVFLWYNLFRFWYHHVPRKIWQPCCKPAIAGLAPEILQNGERSGREPHSSVQSRVARFFLAQHTKKYQMTPKNTKNAIK
jgi:hypothetical protein